jgi:hypothetical protein
LVQPLVHPENRPGSLKKSAGTLPLRTNHGTDSKVSTPPHAEQTELAVVNRDSFAGL